MGRPRDGKDLTATQRRIAWSLARNDLCVARVARELHYSSSNVYFHIQKIKDKTGLDPRSFYGLTELLTRLGEGVDAA